MGQQPLRSLSGPSNPSQLPESDSAINVFKVITPVPLDYPVKSLSVATTQHSKHLLPSAARLFSATSPIPPRVVKALFVHSDEATNATIQPKSII